MKRIVIGGTKKEKGSRYIPWLYMHPLCVHGNNPEGSKEIE